MMADRRLVARCRSSTARAAVAMNQRRKNLCAWWDAVTRVPATIPGYGRVPFGASLSPAAPRLLDEFAAFLHSGIDRPPRHDRHRRSRVLGGALDQLVRINHIDQHVPLPVAAAYDLHLLEEKRSTLPEHVVALRHLVLEMDRADLAAGQRDIRHLLGDPQPALDAAPLGYREVTGHPLDLRIIDAIGCEFVVRTEPLEHRGAAE